ncbi:MAG TPA: ankyrin repeat domain-containing protein [Vicinamibacterales bacterium]|nr:ankyrin repeat domain-containing protein [Vicinamibacterales bacterium]
MIAVMHRFMLLVGIGMSLLAAGACGDGPTVPLAVVAARNAADLVHRLPREHHDPNERDRNGLTPLMWAARTGAVDAMTALLDGGADPAARDVRNGWTPLFHAIHTQQTGAVQLLLDRGVDPNQRARLLTPLIMAAADRNPAIVKLLLAHGADPRRRGIGGETALSVAVSGGALTDIDRPLLGSCHPDTVRALKQHDPAVDMPETIAGWQALWWAKFHGCREVLDLVEPRGTNSKS